MLKMFQRQLGASHISFARQGSSELMASPSALSRSVSRNKCLSRRALAGPSSLSHSRSRTSLLLACSTANNGPYGEGDADSSIEARAGDDTTTYAAADTSTPSAFSSPSPASSASPAHPPLNNVKAERQPPPHPHPQGQQQLQLPTWDFSPKPYVPSPSNLPTNGNEEPLLFPPRPPLWTWTSQPGVDMFRLNSWVWNRLRQVFVILFGVGERETEGIYSLRAFSSDGTTHETIIAFESEEEAQRYAGLLEASMDHKPHVCSIPTLELVSFCLDQTYSCRLEPKGSLLIPPDFNVAVTDWERSLRLRDGKFAVLDSEPERRGLGGGGSAAASTVTATAPPPATAGGSRGGHSSLNLPPPPPLQPGGFSNFQEVAGGDPSMMARYSGLSRDELDQIRARLEALLPQ